MVDLPIEELPVDPTVAWVFPGQGAQHVGMGADLIDISDDARSVFSQADSALNMPISNLCFEGPEEELSRTINTQPAIVTHSIADNISSNLNISINDKQFLLEITNLKKI